MTLRHFINQCNFRIFNHQQIQTEKCSLLRNLINQDISNQSKNRKWEKIGFQLRQVFWPLTFGLFFYSFRHSDIIGGIVTCLDLFALYPLLSRLHLFKYPIPKRTEMGIFKLTTNMFPFVQGTFIWMNQVTVICFLKVVSFYDYQAVIFPIPRHESLQVNFSRNHISSVCISSK